MTDEVTTPAAERGHFFSNYLVPGALVSQEAGKCRPPTYALRSFGGRSQRVYPVQSRTRERFLLRQNRGPVELEASEPRQRGGGPIRWIWR